MSEGHFFWCRGQKAILRFLRDSWPGRMFMTNPQHVILHELIYEGITPLNKRSWSGSIPFVFHVSNMVTPHISSLVSQQKDQKVSNVYIFLWLSQEKVSNKSMVKSTQSFGPLPTGHPGTRRAAALIAVLLGLHSLSFIPQAQGVPRRCWYGYSVYDENVCIVYEYVYIYIYIDSIWIYIYICMYIIYNYIY